MRRSRGSLSPRQGWPGLSSLGNQLDFPCTSHPARPGYRSAEPPALPQWLLSLSAVWLAVTSPRRTAAATRGAEIAVALDNPQDGVSPLFTAYRLMTGNPLLPSYNRPSASGIDVSTRPSSGDIVTWIIVIGAHPLFSLLPSSSPRVHLGFRVDQRMCTLSFTYLFFSFFVWRDLERFRKERGEESCW